MPANERGGLRAAFAGFTKPEQEKDAERKLLGRVAEAESSQVDSPQLPSSYQVATASTGLVPRPLLEREAVRQLSFRCPASIASTLKRKAAFNQLEQQEIIVEGIKRVLAELPDPPTGWEP